MVGIDLVLFEFGINKKLVRVFGIVLRIIIFQKKAEFT